MKFEYEGIIKKKQKTFLLFPTVSSFYCDSYSVLGSSPHSFIYCELGLEIIQIRITPKRSETFLIYSPLGTRDRNAKTGNTEVV